VGTGEREGWRLGMLGMQKKKLPSFLGKILLTIILNTWWKLYRKKVVHVSEYIAIIIKYLIRIVI
jgi:hypothetical protein